MSDFKIAAAQVASVRGDIERNIATHVAAVSTAAAHGVSVLIFPELSLTGYEPDLAEQFAITPDDDRLTSLATLAREDRIDVVVGAPLRSAATKPYLGAIVFAADGTTRTYAKMHLGGSERKFFMAGESPMTIATFGQRIGLAICADSSQPSHPQAYAESGATIYAAGVFLNAEWYATDSPRLADYALRHRMLVVMANHADSIGTYKSVGKSAAWAPDGTLVAQADGVENSLIIAANSGTWRGEMVKI